MTPKIAYLAAGAAGMYCGSCLHDNTLCAAMLDSGEDVLLIPLYTPLRTDEIDVSEDRVFFGGINLYLREKSALFRALPRWSTRWLDNPAVLNLLTKRAGGNDARELGPLTISMLEGADGLHRAEVERIGQWLAEEIKPDVLHLGNALLLGMAPELKRMLGVPLVCSLGGEDSFIEKIDPPHRETILGLLQDRSRSIDAFVAMNQSYADRMSDYLDVDRKKIEVIPHGLRLDGFPSPSNTSDLPRKSQETETDRKTKGDRSQQDNLEPDGPKTIGYFARVCPDKGLKLLAEAFASLAAEPELSDLELWAGGYLAIADRGYLADIRNFLEQKKLGDRFHYVGELDHAGKIAFMGDRDVMALPTRWPEAKGLSALESLAAGAPIVVPDHGSFPEMVQETGGGLLHCPGQADSLAAAIRRLLLEPDLAANMAKTGQKTVHERFHAKKMAKSTRELYGRLVGEPD